MTETGILSVSADSKNGLVDGMEEERTVHYSVMEELPQGNLHLSFRGIVDVVCQRTVVLVVLLLIQSLSQFVLGMYEGLISRHVMIPMFLTMIIGAGGNAGNQSAVRCITGLTTREFRRRDFLIVLRKEFVCGLIISLLLTVVGFARVYYFYWSQFYSTIAISMSLFCVLMISALFGTTLPFFFQFVGINREHAAPCIQVLMDIVGVFITCFLCSLVIPASEGSIGNGVK
ncbi:Mg++ transporter [Trypanosoma rangeli]|uniref:Mg++ transporter n=1 Tax=Trypanosoma rangeli TaxID=5698 RepID=A0A3R7KD17_TRYRA|nr:Mg++ transporter [Trypanosoma rangeli]RNF05642.1 Mg++ transporter [Trypanosoma rangeli]|eukprot:RNF05642.1 Mg++ transporter [Trypanosoma rangeli]